MNINAKIERSFNLSGRDFHKPRRAVFTFLFRMTVTAGVMFAIAMLLTIAERGI